MARITESAERRTKSLRTLFDLSGQVALITGGSRGLGLQIAEALGEFGATPVLEARKGEELAKAVKHLAHLDIRAGAVPADLGRPDAPVRVVDNVMEQFGRIDVLVNNAGATWGAPAEEYPPDAWAKVLNLNLNLNVTGLFLLTQAVARSSFIPEGRGKVVNIASTEGLGGHHPRMAGTVAYNASKGAVVNMTRALVAEWGLTAST